MLRPELTEALESVASQTYPNIEVVLVNASGSGVVSIPGHLSGLTIKQVDEGKQLPRPMAANLGLETASGEYLMFLDDDDWIASDHISALVEVLGKSGTLAAYSDTCRARSSGELVDEKFDRDFDIAVLMRDNFLPIHSVVFSRKLVEKGCRFDSALEIYEDWDFWLQVAQHTDFSHHVALTAFYRDGGRSGTEVETLMQKYEPGHPNALAREQVLSKWIPHWKGKDVNRMLGTMVRFDVIEDLEQNLGQARDSIENQRREIKDLKKHSEQQNESIKSLEQTTSSLQNTLQEFEQDLQKTILKLQAANRDVEQFRFENNRLESQYQNLEKHFEEVVNSFSWRITKPYRFISLRFKLYLLNPAKRLARRLFSANVLPSGELADGSRVLSTVTKSISGRSEILFSIDTPSSDRQLFSDSLLLHGWAHSKSGPVEIAVSVDGLEYSSFYPSLSRPDVSHLFPGSPGVLNCGFSESLSLRYLPSGEHSLRLTITSQSGAVTSFERSFVLFRQEELYNAWLSCKTDQFRKDASVRKFTFSEVPLYVVIPVGGDKAADLRTLESLAEQENTEYQLLFIGDSWEVLASELDKNSREKLESNIQICATITNALQLVEDEQGWVAIVYPGSVLSPFALQRLQARAVQTKADLVYCDHDVVNGDGLHSDPVFTFGWSPEHLISSNYIGNVYLVSTQSLLSYSEKLGAENWGYQLLVRMAFGEPMVERLPEVLWSSLCGTSLLAKDQNFVEEQIIRRELVDQGLSAELEINETARSLKWRITQGTNTKVSIIIPTMGKLQLVQPCIESLLKNTDYPDYEVIILDNSRGANPEGIHWLRKQGLRIVECDEAFNWSRLNNRGAAVATGGLLLFLNDDIEISQSTWLEELVSQALRPEVGAVGCKLLYPNGALQHAGVILVNHGGGCAHLFHKMPPGRHIYQRLDQRVRETSAVTGACLMVKREWFDELNGFDEELGVVGNDIDFCLRLLDRGQRNIWTPRCTLVHHESISREPSAPPEDEQAMWRRWESNFTAGDYYYNPNLSRTIWDCRQEFDVPSTELLAKVYENSGSGNLDNLKETQVHSEQRYEQGVNLIGYIRADMGVGEGARSDARALAAADIDFGIINFESGNPASMTNRQWESKEILNAPFDINLIHVNGNFLAAVMEELPDHFIKGRYNIAYWAWELEELPQDWVPHIQLVDEIWVPSDFVRAAVEKVSTVPVVTIPHNVDLAPTYAFSRSHFGIPEESFAFLSMYDTNSIAERKNPRAVLTAFQSVFEADDESVCLVLKLNNATSESISELNNLIGKYSNIVILQSQHNRQQIDSLLTQIDCFVSLHRSEGFGLGPLEAMSLGKPAILTNWSGNTDYMTEDNCLAVDFDLVTLESDFGPYKAGQRWADADVDQAATYMRKLATDPALAESIGRQARRSIEERFSPRAVGQLVAERLEAIRSTLKESS